MIVHFAGVLPRYYLFYDYIDRAFNCDGVTNIPENMEYFQSTFCQNKIKIFGHHGYPEVV